MDVKFKFEAGEDTHFGKIYRPIARVDFKSPSLNIWITSWMVVDTGADYSLLPRYFAAKLRVSLKTDCLKEVTFGVGGQQIIYFLKKKITAKIGPIERQVPLAFLDGNEVPALLGRLGFLETFDTHFLKTHQVIFTD